MDQDKLDNFERAFGDYSGACKTCEWIDKYN